MGIYDLYKLVEKCRGAHLFVKGSNYCHFCGFEKEFFTKEKKKTPDTRKN
jgi:hypothetical protein